jgi:eukaryotic-like serine/threonine-protein kinase
VLSLVAGVGGWWLAVGRYTHAPSVLRLTFAQAAHRLDDAGLHAQQGSEVYSDNVAPGRVVTQDPGGGERVHRGAAITLHLSRGPETVRVPDVSGKKVHAATVALRRVNLRFAGQDEAYSSLVEAGRVIRTRPKAGETVSAERGITLVVSKGARPVDVPDVTNKPYDEAASMLRAVSLHPRRTDVFSDTVPEGEVVSTSPAAGSTAHVGDTVTVNVSKGPRLIQVPNVTGKPIQAAIKQINQAGFRAQPRQIFPGGPGKVVVESPSGMQRPGTTIVLRYY